MYPAFDGFVLYSRVECASVFVGSVCTFRHIFANLNCVFDDPGHSLVLFFDDAIYLYLLAKLSRSNMAVCLPLCLSRRRYKRT
jgi:hypothetical protein